MTRADRLRRWSARALYAAGATTALLNLLGRLGTWDWRLDLLVHFKPQVATLLAAVALALFGLGRRRGALAFAALCAIEVAAIAPYYLVAGTAEAGEKPAASALSLNLMRWNEQYGPVREYIQAQAPDVVTLQEVDRRWLAALAPMEEHFPYKVVPGGRIHTVVLYSRWPLADVRIRRDPLSYRPIISATVQAPSGEFTMITAHTQAPIGPRGDNAARARERQAQLAIIAGFARHARAPALAMGDFNITPWSRHFRRFLDASGLREARRGHGLLPTWPARFPPLRIPIDQCLHGPRIEVLDLARGPRLGSDHLPLLLRFRVG